MQPLASAYARRDAGELPEELGWIDIAHKALNELAKTQNVVVVSQTEIKARPELVEDIKRDGRQIVLLTDREKQRADQQAEEGKAPFQTLRTWIQSFNDNFQYQFVDESEFTGNENAVWQSRNQILGLVGVRPNAIPRIRVSETMCTSADGTTGAWDSKLNAIVVKRTQLRSLPTFAGTLLHELAHATTGAVDCTRFFENTLTEYHGKVAATALSGVTPSVDHTDEPHNKPSPAASEAPLVLGGIAFVPVESSNISGVAYNDETRTLYVTFKNGSRYFYQGVPPTVHEALINAPSKGRYLNTEIIGRYKYGSI